MQQTLGRFQSMDPPSKKPAEEKAICAFVGLRPRFMNSLNPGNFGGPLVFHMQKSGHAEINMSEKGLYPQNVLG